LKISQLIGTRRLPEQPNLSTIDCSRGAPSSASTLDANYSTELGEVFIMIDWSSRISASSSQGPRIVQFGIICALAAVIATVSSGRAGAQAITTQMLIGDAVSTDSLSRYTDVDEAIKRFINRDVLAARTFLETAKKKDANLPPVDLLMAKMYFLGGNAAGGRASLEKSAADNPEDPEPFLILADQATQQGRTIEADALYEKGLELTTKFKGSPKRKRNFEIRARAGRAAVAQRRKNWDTAVSDLQSLLKLDPDNAVAHYRLGQTLFMLNKFEDGYKEFQEAKAKDKNLPDSNVATALMYDQLKMADKAARSQKFFDMAMTASKNDPATVTAYAQWLIKSGTPQNLAKAESMLAEARKANPGNLNLLILSGVAARMAKKMKPAEDFFVEALGIAPANGDVINQLALLLIEQADQSKRDRALQFAGMSSQLNSQNADAQITLAWVLYQLGRVADAEQALRNGLNLGSPSPDSTYLVARILKDQNKADAAKQLLKGAIDQESPGIFVYRQDAQALLDGLNQNK
jgi:tetratricopeptide (TPR) repeat protein